jgi:hypothetical protein
LHKQLYCLLLYLSERRWRFPVANLVRRAPIFKTNRQLYLVSWSASKKIKDQVNVTKKYSIDSNTGS